MKQKPSERIDFFLSIDPSIPRPWEQMASTEDRVNAIIKYLDEQAEATTPHQSKENDGTQT